MIIKVLIKQYKKIKGIINRKMSYRNKNVNPFVFGCQKIYLKTLYYLILIIRSSKYSFKLLIEDEKYPLGIKFLNKETISLSLQKKMFSSEEVKQAYIKEYLELVHHKKQKKAKLSTLAMALSVVVISLFVSSITTMIFPNVSVTEAAGESWLSGYTYRRVVTIDNTKVATTTDSFVVLATTTLAGLKTTGNGGNVENANGYDIVWTDSDGDTVLDFEVEKYDATTGEIVHWIETDVSSTTDKVLYMYYGNSDISTDQATTTGTWASDYAGVWHMDNAYNASSTDSTSNANNGSMINQYSATSSVTGIADTALDFDGSDDYVDVYYSDSLNLITANAFTASFWVKTYTITDINSYGCILCKGGWDLDSGFEIIMDRYGSVAQPGEIGLDIRNMGGTTLWTDESLVVGDWYHVVATWDGTNARLYQNGVNMSSSTPGETYIDNGEDLLIGQASPGMSLRTNWDGLIDEVRVSNIAKTDADVLTEYNNQVAVTEFMTFGAESDVNDSPTSPSNPIQYTATTTREILNTDYTNNQSIDLQASTTDSDTTETITLFFELQESATAFDSTATPTTGTSCAAGVAIADCATNIWYVTSSSGDYSSTPYTATTTVSGLVEDTSYKWQVKACDDESGCSSWVEYNATTPNFTRDDFFGMAATRSITIDADQVTSNLTNFPMLFSTTLDDLKATSTNGRIQKTDATDIVFTASDGTYLDYEIEKYTSSTGELIAWVELDSISSTTNTTLNMYYGDIDSVDHSTTTGVWASDYAGVWHFGNDTTASTTDSTSYANNGSAMGNASSTASGQVGGAFAFDGDGDYIELPSNTGNYTDNFTIVSWFKTATNGRCAISRRDGVGIQYDMYVAGTILQYYDGGFGAGATVVTDDIWHMGVWVISGSSSQIYVDGKADGYTFTANIIDEAGEALIGAWLGGVASCNGSMDEVRISSSARSAQYIETIYNSQNSTSTFYTIGVETPNSNPATPTLSQYYGGNNTAQIVNGEYINASTVMLQASTTDSDTSEALTVYFEVASTTQSFNSPATPTVATSCTSATTRANCATSIWYAQSTHGDYSGGTTTQVVIGGIASSTSMMWQVNACDDDGGCSGWTAFNATTPNFTNYQYFGNSYYKVITIDNTKVTSNLTNFPVLYSVTDTNLKATTSGGYVGNLLGNDILFANSSGEKLYHEIDEYDSTTGVLTAWVNLDSISSTTDTVINMYYGSSTIPIQSSSTATWASDYVGVWHLGSNDDATDSTSNANNGTAYDNASSTDNLVYNSGKVAEAFSFDGAGDYVDLNGTATGGTNPLELNDSFTISTWINFAESKSSYLINNYQGAGDYNGNHINLHADPSGAGITIEAQIDDNVNPTALLGDVLNLNQWYYIVLVRDKGNTFKVHVDGVESDSEIDITTSSVLSSVDWVFGARALDKNTEFFNGTIDEVRISSSARSEQYVSTSYNNQNSTSTFYTIGVQQPNVAPNAPTLVSPSDASNTNDNTPTLSVNYTDADIGDVGTTDYRISSVSAQDCLDDGTIVDSGTSSETSTINETTSYTPSSSIGSDGTYYWCARNSDGVALSVWTSMGSLVLDTTAPTNIAIDVITADSSTQITVISASSTDATVGVHPSTYWFNETSNNDGGTDSTTYQGSKTYIDSGLTPNTQYSYQVRSKDLIDNVSSYSTVVASTTIYTLASVPSTPTLSVNSSNKITATWGANSNPSGTYFNITNGSKGTNSGWITATTWISSELACNTSYSFTVRARNANNIESVDSSSVSATTESCGVASFFMPSLFGGNTDSSDGGDTTVDTPQDSSEDVLVINDPEPITSEDLTEEDIEELEDLGILPEEEIIIPQDVSDALLEEELIDQELDLVELIQDIPLVINELGIEGLDLIDLSMEQLDEIAQYALLSNDLSDLTKQFPSLGDTLDNTNIDLNIKKDLENIKGISFTLPGITNSALSSGSISPSQLASEVTRTTKVTTNSISGKPIVALISKATPLGEMSKEVKEAIPEDLVFIRTSDEFIDISTKVEITSNNKIEKKITVSSNQDIKLAIKPKDYETVEGVKGYLILKEIDRTSMNDVTKPVVRNTWFNSLISPVYAMDLRLPRISGNGGRVLGEQDSPLLEERGQEEVLDPKPDQLLVLMEFDYLDEDNDGIYTTGITTPPVEGTFEILTAISYKYQKTPKIVRLTTVIDPEGYVYYIDDRTNEKARISNAKVSLYLQTSENEYILWPANEFNQENPQITTDNGKYSFLVPEGTYQLKVEAENYNTYSSKPFKVKEGSSVHENIELKGSVWLLERYWWQITIVLLLIVLIVLVSFLLLKIKK